MNGIFKRRAFKDNSSIFVKSHLWFITYLAMKLVEIEIMKNFIENKQIKRVRSRLREVNDETWILDWINWAIKTNHI